MVRDVMWALGRRWYLVAVGLVLTAAMVAGAYFVSPPKYNASALVLMLPAKGDVGNGGNPFLMLDGLEQPAGILAAYFSSEPSREEVERVSPDAEYTVGIDDSTRGPVLAIDVTDTSPQAALQTLDFLLQRIPDELLSLQRQVDARGAAVVGSMQLSVDTSAKMDARGTIRTMIAALVAGTVGTAVVSYTLDGVLLRRRTRRWTMAELDEPDDDTPSPDAAALPEPARVAVTPSESPTAEAEQQETTPVRTTAGPDDDADDRSPVASGWSWGERAS